MKDLFGKAILDFQTNNSPEDLITETSISEEDEMSVEYLFRSYDKMPKLEQKALQLASIYPARRKPVDSANGAVRWICSAAPAA